MKTRTVIPRHTQGWREDSLAWCVQRALHTVGAQWGTLGICPVFMLCSFALQGMITLILATDMARHAEIMDSFKEKMENFDYSNEEHMTLVSRLVSPLGVGELVRESFPQTRNRETTTPPCLGGRCR